MDGYRTLNPISMKSMRIKYIIPTAILTIISVVCWVFRDYNEGMIYAASAVTALAVLFLLSAIFLPKILFNHYRYFISEDRVDVRKGIFFLRHSVVPIERIHQVEVVSGPINRMYGLADVEVTTAGGTSSIEYLEKEEADRIAEELNIIVGRIVRSQNE